MSRHPPHASTETHNVADVIDDSTLMQDELPGFTPSDPVDSARRAVVRTALEASERIAPCGITLADYSVRWLNEGAEDLRCSRGYRSILSAHLDLLAPFDLAHLIPPVSQALFALLRCKPGRGGRPLSPRTRRNVRRFLRTMLGDAVADGLITANPVVQSRRDKRLDRIRDADPEWRARAVFNREEIVALLTDRRIPGKVRAAIAILFFTGARESELAGFTWNALDPDGEPLGALNVAWSYSTADGVLRPPKNDRARRIPVHATLMAILEWWYEKGWRLAYGRSPQSADPIIASQVRGGRVWLLRNDRAWKWLERACRVIGIRQRGIHVLRGTFATMAQEGGAPAAIVERIGWNSAEGDEGGRVLAGYSRFSWPSLCSAIGCIDLGDINFGGDP